MVAAALTVAVTGAALLGGTVVTATLAVAVTGTSATATALFGTAAGGQFGSRRRIGLHIVGIVAQLADLGAQLVGVGLLRIVIDGQLRRLHVVGVGLDAFEIGHVLFELVGALLAHAVGLDGHGLLVLGGRLLSAHAQGDEAY